MFKPGKSSKVKFTFHKKATDSPVDKLSHVSYAVKGDGSVSTSTSVLQKRKGIEGDEQCETTGNNLPYSEGSNSFGAEEAPAIEVTLEEPLVDQAYLEHVGETVLDEKEKAARTRPKGDESLHQWEPMSDMFLAELIRMEGRGCWPSETCVDCGGEGAIYGCKDCHGREMTCSDCTVKRHARTYLHRISKWNGSYFERVSLKALGLRIQLGHPPGEKCAHSETCADDDFCIIDVNGVHNVAVDFCGCGRSNQQHTVQLLRSRLFPATVVAPKTAATFGCLETFELLSYESKCTAFEYYRTLTRLTDNTGLVSVKDRYLAFIRMTHEWRHLKMLKRAGRGHDPDRPIAQTAPGECAVLCPACPQPGKNMMPGWEDEPPERRFLHALFVALDANFRLKRKKVSSDEADPGLSKGWAYVVNESLYKTHLEKYKNEKEPKSTCSRHDAVNLSNSDHGPGHAASGVGTVDCSRHDMKRPNGVGDLQKGERYCNMDYMFWSSLKGANLKAIVISYDIACQWSINLKDRMSVIDEYFWIFHSDEIKVMYLVPKFHLPAHILFCRTVYAFNYAPGVGRTDGEAPERGWANINPLAPSTREMGPGTRRNTLDYHFGDANWQKVTRLGTALHRKLKAAAIDMAEHRIGHRELERTLPTETIAQWTSEIKAWENDKSQSNPFELMTEGPTQAQIRRQLAEEEAKDLEAGRDFALDEDMTPAVLISAGLDLEAEQRAVQVLSKDIWDHSRDRQKTALQLRKNALHRKINAWLGYLTLYIPGVSLARSRMATTSPDPELKPQDVTLWLPSQVPSDIPVNERLRQIEAKLRHAQAYESLSRLRQHLQARAYLYKFKDRFIRGQGANTRARNTIDAVTAKINAAASEYRAAYSALLALSPGLNEVEWKNELLLLRDQDIRDLSEGKAKESEGRRTISWIWKSIPVELQAEDDGVEKGYLRERVRVEWCQSRARSLRFSEEVDLLTEEMARVLRFFEWMTKDWLQKAGTMLSKDFPKPLAEAYKAYAERQAAMYTSLEARFKGLWADLPAHVSQMCSIAERELTTVSDGLFKAQKTRGRPPKNNGKQAKKKKVTHEDLDSSTRT